MCGTERVCGGKEIFLVLGTFVWGNGGNIYMENWGDVSEVIFLKRCV